MAEIYEMLPNLCRKMLTVGTGTVWPDWAIFQSSWQQLFLPK